MLKLPLTAYGDDGKLKVPFWFYLIIAFQLKTYIAWVVVVASRSDNPWLLEVMYPIRDYFYAGLASGLPAIIVWLLVSRRNALESNWTTCLIAKGRGLLYLAVLMELMILGIQITFQKGQYSTGLAIPLVVNLWLLLFIPRSLYLKELCRADSLPKEAKASN